MNQRIETEANSVQTVRQLVDFVAEKHGENLAFVIRSKGAERTVSYTRFRTDIGKAAFSLRSSKIRAANIAIVGELCYDWIVAFLGTICSGNVAVPIDKDLSAEEMSEQLSRANADVVFFDRSCAQKAQHLTENAPERKCISFEKHEGCESVEEYLESENMPELGFEASPDAAAILIFTSGTTGVSKIVELTNRNICDDVYCCYLFLKDAVKPGDKNIPVLPPHHMFALTANILTGLYLGATLCFGGGVKKISDTIKYFKPSIMLLVPMIVESMYKKIWVEAKKQGRERTLKRAIKLSNVLRKIKIDMRKTLFRDILGNFGGNLKTIICGGAFLEPELVLKYEELGICLRNGYGITECSPVVACNLNKLNKPGSAGLIAPSPYCDVKIIDGEICVKGSIVMFEYYKDPAASKEAFVSGYFKTGDLGYVDRDHYLYITGRKKNLIISSDGNNISPEELEILFEKIPLVKSVMICAEEGPHHAMITARIFPDHGYAADNHIGDVKEALDAEVKKINAALPSYKRIQQVEVVEADFQKTALGKIKRYLHS